MQCLECGRTVKSINYKHLQSCSGITPQEYRQRHPNAELMDQSVKDSCALKLEHNPNWKGGKTYRYCKGCNKRLARNTQGNSCSKCRDRIGENNPFFGKHHSAQTRKKMVIANKNRDPSTYKGGGMTSEQASLIQKRYWQRLSKDEKANRLASFIEAGQIHNKRSKKTKIENLMASILDDLGISHQRNVQIGRYNVDFLVNNTHIIECFSDFWHCNPNIYEPHFFNKSLKMTAKEKWLKDQRRRKSLEERGLKFASFWGLEIRNETAKVRKKLQVFFHLESGKT